MVNARRSARELALRILYQIDVGRQSVPEAFSGALEQIRIAVDNPVRQIAEDSLTALLQAAASLSDGFSTTASRQVKAGARSAGTALRRLADVCAEEGRRAMLADGPGQVQDAETRSRAALAEAKVALQRLAVGDPVVGRALESIASLGNRRAAQIEQVFRKHLGPSVASAAFARALVGGVLAHGEEIDARLAALSTGWALERQAAVDRNIMRLAAYEMLYVPEIPMGASINEAIEMAKKYSTDESGRFVNGVLGTLAGQLDRPGGAGEGADT